MNANEAIDEIEGAINFHGTPRLQLAIRTLRAAQEKRGILEFELWWKARSEKHGEGMCCGMCKSFAEAGWMAALNRAV